jgi:hypothetical protein
MLIEERVAFLRSCIGGGQPTTVSFLPNPQLHRVKVKIVVSPFAAPCSRVILEAAFRALDQVVIMSELYSSIDRGHRHSDGSYEVAIWFSVPDAPVESPMTPPRAPRRPRRVHAPRIHYGGTPLRHFLVPEDAAEVVMAPSSAELPASPGESSADVPAAPVPDMLGTPPDAFDVTSGDADLADISIDAALHVVGPAVAPHAREQLPRRKPGRGAKLARRASRAASANEVMPETAMEPGPESEVIGVDNESVETTDMAVDPAVAPLVAPVIAPADSTATSAPTSADASAAGLPTLGQPSLAVQDMVQFNFRDEGGRGAHRNAQFHGDCGVLIEFLQAPQMWRVKLISKDDPVLIPAANLVPIKLDRFRELVRAFLDRE